MATLDEATRIADGGRGERILVTGASGFVGGWALAALGLRAPQAQVIAAGSGSADAIGGSAIGGSMVGARAAASRAEPVALDLRDAAATERLVRDLRPTAVLHLAAIADIPTANADPDACWAVNLGGTMALGRAALAHAPACRFVFAGTGEAYGASFRGAAGPLDEQAPLAPTNPYATSKAAADLLVGQFAESGLPTVRFRPFNHTGPGQSERFVASAFAAQIARIEAGLAPPVMRVGNLDAERDFLDVRDVVEAYMIAVLGVRPIPRGAVLNLASGAARPIRALLDALRALSRVAIDVGIDPERLRPSDTPRTVGDASRARALLGWSPRIAWETTLADLLDHWRRHTPTN